MAFGYYPTTREAAEAAKREQQRQVPEWVRRAQEKALRAKELSR